MKFTLEACIFLLGDANELPQTFYLDVTVKNKWKNPVSFIWPSEKRLNSVVVPSDEERKKMIVTSSDEHPDSVLIKLADQKDNTDMTRDTSVRLNYTTSSQPVVLQVDEKGGNCCCSQIKGRFSLIVVSLRSAWHKPYDAY